MKILWMTWKDVDHPLSGGAEAVNQELMKRLAKNGHHVILLTAGFEGGKANEMRDGYRIIRVGNRWTVYYRAYQYYKAQLNGWPDLVIDEVNAVPFFAKRYVAEKNILFIHQLYREMWFYELPFPLSLVGYFLEPVFLRALSGTRVVTVSESTKADLVRYRFSPEEISVISEGIQISPIDDLDMAVKFSQPTIISLGVIKEIKRTDHIVRAFLLAKQQIPELQLILVGKEQGRYARKVREMVKKSRYNASVKFTGKVTEAEKIELLRQAHVLCIASVKEGWGLTVTEANAQGTPAVAYDVDGLRDSIRHGKTGLLAGNDDPSALADAMVMLLGDHEEYERLRHEAWEWSKSITFDESYRDFIEVINGVMEINIAGEKSRSASEETESRELLGIGSLNEGHKYKISDPLAIDNIALTDAKETATVTEMSEHLPQGSWGDQLEPPQHTTIPEESHKELLLFKNGWRSFRSPSFLRPKIRNNTIPSKPPLKRSETIRIPEGKKV